VNIIIDFIKDKYGKIWIINLKSFELEKENHWIKTMEVLGNIESQSIRLSKFKENAIKNS